jgi:hypothetical protein
VYAGAYATEYTGTATKLVVGTNVHQKSTNGYVLTYSEKPGASGAHPIASPE